MVATRRKAVAADTTASPKGRNAAVDERRRRSAAGEALAGSASASAAAEDGYEKQREERIRGNMERMQKLGIFDLSLELKKRLPSPRNTVRGGGLRTPLDPAKSLLAPTRRSSRLKNAAPVRYADAPVDEPARKKSTIKVADGQKEEIYTEEHEKLLGLCETGWTLFVDGCGPDGKRIYDSTMGKTCHQCRQKTLGHRTHCCKCNLVQGQFCGDCLFMRYGENVLEAQKNPNWICPVCRGICNCSLCRLKRGWVPTGALYKKVLSWGFKSVAHYLIQTRRLQTSSAIQNSCQASSKKSLTFTDAEESSLIKPEKGLNIAPSDKDKCNEKGSPGSKHEPTFNNAAAENTTEVDRKSRKKEEPAATLLPSPDSIAARLRSAHKPTVSNVAAAELNRRSRKKKEPAVSAIPSPDSVASRLRKRRKA